jgi:hypothetical protein
MLKIDKKLVPFATVSLEATRDGKAGRSGESRVRRGGSRKLIEL